MIAARAGIVAFCTATACAASPALLQTRPSTVAAPPQAKLTAEQDHQRMMDLLGIKSLRRGADGNPQSQFAAKLTFAKMSTVKSVLVAAEKTLKQIQTGS